MTPLQQPWIWTILPILPILFVYLVGIVATIVLLWRRRSTPAVLALLGFGLGFVVRLAQLGRAPLIQVLVESLGIDVYPRYLEINAAIGCCCSLFDVIALTSLIVAIWQAVSAAAPTGEIAEDEEDFGTLGSGGNPYATQKLSDEPPATGYATQVLNERDEDVVEGAWEDIEGDSE